MISSVVAAFFGALALIFLSLSVLRGPSPARKTWRRIGIIFALVALVIFVLRQR